MFPEGNFAENSCEYSDKLMVLLKYFMFFFQVKNSSNCSGVSIS